MASKVFAAGQPNCRITTEPELVDNLVPAIVESVSDVVRMIAANCVVLKVFQVDLGEIDILV